MAFSDIVIKDQNLKFKIKDVDMSVVNSLRRIILSEIPCVAFYFDTYDQDKQHIIIKKNTGVLHNEFLAHRISLIPLYFDEQEINKFDPSQYKFILKEKNATDDVKLITTEHFTIYENDKKMPDSFREHVFPKCKITGDHILITKLRPNLYDNSQGEELDIECIATVGIAQEHARWASVSQCAYHNTVDIEASTNALDEQSKNLSVEDKKKLQTKFEVLEKYRYFKKNIYDEPNEFEFVIESECRLTPKQIFVKALDVLYNKINNFKERISTLKVTHTSNFQEIEIKNENHTLLNVLQSLIYNFNFRQNKKENPLDYIGYYQYHALDDTMILKIRFKNSMEESIDLEEFLQNSCKDIQEYIQNLKNAFLTV